MFFGPSGVLLINAPVLLADTVIWQLTYFSQFLHKQLAFSNQKQTISLFQPEINKL